ncbi:PadR family transcriptional regulator [Paenibacillus daejeonensis]|uniref:PadR family transcriptional regulator n=1 Tax=Paenibacillus daejeonensis TaxID=135193 RepID=UPI000375A951|nr:PadR family transcriptional regulator [Paenibacillus daejeonensis]
MLDNVILGMLLQGKMSGYDLKKIIEQSVGIFYKVSYGSLYPTLKRMSEQGLIDEEETGNTKNKKLYSIRPEGTESFQRWLKEPLQANKREHLIKIFFYDYLDESTRQQQLEAYQRGIQMQIAQMEAVQQIVAGELEHIENKEDYYHRLSVMYYGIQFFKMENDWLETIRTRGKLN